jgi:ADP-ribose pyrophosphatase
MNKLHLGPHDYEITQREILYQGIFRLVRLHVRHKLFNGDYSDIFTREILERFTAAAVLPYDPKLDRVILIEQFRPGAITDPKGPWQIEIPAGVITHNDPPMDTAIREAKEEANCEVRDLELIQDYFVSPGGSNEYIHIFYGSVDATHIEGVYGLHHEHEDIRVLNISTEEAFAKLKNHEIKNAPAIIALQWLHLNRERLRLV